MIAHRRYLHAEARKIQRAARKFLKKSEEERKYIQGRDQATRLMQRCWRGHKGRDYVKQLKVDREKFKDTVRGLTKIQTRVRMRIAKKELIRRQLGAYVEPTILLQRQVRIHLARK